MSSMVISLLIDIGSVSLGKDFYNIYLFSLSLSLEQIGTKKPALKPALDLDTHGVYATRRRQT